MWLREELGAARKVKRFEWKEQPTMKAFIKWTAVTAAVITGASFAYSLVQAARRRVDQGLATAEQVAEDAKQVLASTQRTLDDTQRTVRHLRSTVS